MRRDEIIKLIEEAARNGQTKLDLSKNQLSELPAEIGQLVNLTTLDLSRNQLSELPIEIGQLVNLTTLHLSGNKLSVLPVEVTQLVNLTTLDLEENPLKSPPLEIAGQGVEVIFKYLRQLSEKETEATLVNEAKLILVGQGGVGKTCLAKRLIYDEFIEDKTTEGIDILKWSITAPTNKKEEIKLNVWDFGGQEIYHATHQFFLTKRSVYLLVWNARKSHDYEHIYYWLHTIEAFGEDSPIILVLSKLNERNDDLNMTDLREKFPQIIDLYKVDSEDGKGIPALKNIISDTAWQLPHTQTPWVASWLRVRELLEQNEKNWIGYNEFIRICQSEGLDKKQTDILDEYLHDLGVIIHFQDIKLRDMVILKPEWATKAVYKILDADSIRERDGILLHSELGQIWDSGIYPQNIHSKLLELMNKFELAYELPDERSHLVAELLPSSKPAFEWDAADNLRFVYQYEFLPVGVMTHFIVKMHKDIKDNLLWRTGIVLEDIALNSTAVVKVNEFDKKIYIFVAGTQKKDYLSVIRFAIREINRSFGIKATERVPLPDDPDITISYDYLMNLEIKGIKTFIPEGAEKKYIVNELLSTYSKDIKYLDDALSVKVSINRISNQQQILNLIDAYENEQLVLVLGAGVSIDHELPSWNILLQKLLINTFAISGDNYSNSTSILLAKLFVDFFTPNPLVAARFLKKNHQVNIIGKTTSFEEAVRAAIYEEIDLTKESNTFKEIRQLCVAPGKSPNLDSIITYNYDDILEKYLLDSNIEIPFKSIYSVGMNPRHRELPIYHVHGFLPQNCSLDETNKITFSEDIYHQQYNEIYSWNNIIQINKFRDNVCLFIGVSLTDPNLRRLLDIAMLQKGDSDKHHYLIRKKYNSRVIEQYILKTLDQNQELYDYKKREDLGLDEIVEHLVNIMEGFEENDALSFGVSTIWIQNYDEIPEIINKIRTREFENEILQLLKKLVDKSDTEESLLEKANSIAILQPNIGGLGININELVKRTLKRNK